MRTCGCERTAEGQYTAPPTSSSPPVFTTSLLCIAAGDGLARTLRSAAEHALSGGSGGRRVDGGETRSAATQAQTVVSIHRRHSGPDLPGPKSLSAKSDAACPLASVCNEQLCCFLRLTETWAQNLTGTSAPPHPTFKSPASASKDSSCPAASSLQLPAPLSPATVNAGAPGPSGGALLGWTVRELK
jgi:hypothetical protein